MQTILFLILNIIMYFNVLVFASIFLMMVAQNWYVLLFGAVLFFLNFILKFGSFIVIYKSLKRTTVLKKFLDKIRYDKVFRKFILLIMFLLDYGIIKYISQNKSDYDSLLERIIDNLPGYLATGGGLFLSYLTLVIWFWILDRKKKNDI